MVDSLKLIAKEASDRMNQMQQGGGGRGFRTMFEPVEPNKLPDYFPPIRPGTTLADYEGNAWLLPATSTLAAQLASQPLPGIGGRGMGGAPGGRAGQQQAQRVQNDTTTPQAPQTQYVYDVVNRQGELTYRVKLPAGRQLVGFGPNGAVYMIVREGRSVFLERARLGM